MSILNQYFPLLSKIPIAQKICTWYDTQEEGITNGVPQDNCDLLDHLNNCAEKLQELIDTQEKTKEKIEKLENFLEDMKNQIQEAKVKFDEAEAKAEQNFQATN